MNFQITANDLETRWQGFGRLSHGFCPILAVAVLIVLVGCSDHAGHPVANPGSAKGRLAWETDSKTAAVKLGTEQVVFHFGVTNVASSGTVTISKMHASCGCTVPHLPSEPWVLNPGEGGLIRIDVNLRGKHGVLTKSVTADTSEGPKTLTISVKIPNPVMRGMTQDEREQNLKRAAADRQAVFSGDCAECHAKPTDGKYGETLYVAACGVCHEGEHRATMVPDLTPFKQVATPDYWRQWIVHGKEATLMPAFARSEGGPLSDSQISTLIGYLAKPEVKPAAARSKPGITQVPGGVNQAFRDAWVDKLAWSSDHGLVRLGTDQRTARFVFGVTNVFSAPVVIEDLFNRTANLGSEALKQSHSLAPGGDLQVDIEVTLAPGASRFAGSAIVDTSAGMKELKLTVEQGKPLPEPGGGESSPAK